MKPRAAPEQPLVSPDQGDTQGHFRTVFLHLLETAVPAVAHRVRRHSHINHISQHCCIGAGIGTWPLFLVISHVGPFIGVGVVLADDAFCESIAGVRRPRCPRISRRDKFLVAVAAYVVVVVVVNRNCR